MIISHEHRFIYFAIPKTASSSVRRMLDPYSDVHIVGYPQTTQENPFHIHMRPVELTEVFHAQQRDLEEYMTFTTVRNPWKRIASLYGMIKRNKGHRRYGSFKKWLTSIDPENMPRSSKNPKWHDYGALSCREFLSHGAGEKGVDKVFRIEDGLEQLMNYVQPGLGQDPWDAEAPLVNKNPGSVGYDALYDKETIKIVEDLYACDIATYGYSFED